MGIGLLPIFMVATSAEAEKGCIALEPRVLNQITISVEPLVSAGNYCLSADYSVTRQYSWGGADKSVWDWMLAISASDIDVDLQAMTLRSDLLNLNGIHSEAFEGAKPAKKTSFRTHIVIHDGSIKTRGGAGISFNDLFFVDGLYGSLLSDFTTENPPLALKDLYLKNAADWLRQTLSAVDEFRSHFPRTEHRIERVSIVAARLGIGIKGAGNTISDSTIEIDSGQADIYLFGPDQLVENNLIIFRGEAVSPGSAPIRLHAADNTIIRNNIIVIDRNWPWSNPSPEFAISIVDSKNVLIEKNQIYGARAVSKVWDEASSVIEKGTVLLTIRPDASAPRRSRP